MEVNTGGGESSGSVDTGNAEGIELPTGTNDESQVTKSNEPTKAQVQAMKEKFKFTVDGEEFEEEVDLSDKESIRKRLQLAHAANKRMFEAKTAKQKAFELAQALENDPAEYLKKLGPKGRAAAEQFLLSQIKEEMLTPEEKASRDEKAELEAFRAQKLKAQEDSEKSEMSAREKKYAEDYQNTIITALEKTGLPKTPELVKKMAKLMKDNLDNGLDLTAEELAAEARNDTTSLLKSIIKDATGAQLIAMFGEDIANKIRKDDLEKLRSKQNEVFKSRENPTTPQGSGPKSTETLTMDQWKEKLNERVK